MNAFEVFPNPASNIIHIISPSPVTEVILYNQQGSQVATTVMNNNLAVDHLPVGLYVMIIKTQKYQCVRRILKEW
jgi:hypothetical protein